MKPLVVVEGVNAVMFESDCKKYIKRGYVLSSSYCGIVSSEECDYLLRFQAIFILPKEFIDKWNDVKILTPKPYTNVLAFSRRFGTKYGYINSNGGWVLSADTHTMIGWNIVSYLEPTHWTELPTPQ